MTNAMDAATATALADDGAMEARTLMVDGQELTLRIEASYWRAVEEVCARENLTVEDLIGDVQARLLEQSPRGARRRLYGGVTNSPVSIANAVRIFVVGYFRRAATETGHMQAGHGSGTLFMQTPIDRRPLRT